MEIKTREIEIKSGKAWQVDFTIIHVDGERERVREVAYTGITDKFGHRQPCKTERQAIEEAHRIYNNRLKAKADQMARRLNPEDIIITSPTFSDFYDNKFLPVYFAANDLSDSYKDSFDKAVKYNFIKPFGKLTLDQITIEEIDQLKAKLKVKPKTKNNIFGYLRVILDYAEKIEDLEKAPFIADAEYQKQEMEYYSQEELTALIDTAAKKGPNQLLVVLLGAHAGLRVGEMLGLRWTDINFVANEIVLSNAVWRGKTKGTKSNKVRRIPITPELKKALTSHQHLQSPKVLVSDYSQKRESALTANGIKYWMASILRGAKIDSNRALHKLRHTFAAHLVQANVSLYRVASYLGHSDASVTKTYAHLSNATAQADILTLSRQLSKPA